MSEAPDQPAQQQITRALSYKECYGNTLRFRLTPTDCTITFGNLPDVGGAPVVVIQDEVTVTLTLSFLKTLAINFSGVVAAVENTLGEPIKVLSKSLVSDEQLQALIQVIKDNPLIVPDPK
jgi:hypothetical protein